MLLSTAACSRALSWLAMLMLTSSELADAIIS